jgi:hypothetical protein
LVVSKLWREWQWANELEEDGYGEIQSQEVKEQYQVTIKNKFPTRENLHDNGNINRVWDAIRQNIKMSGINRVWSW